jgi:hypothetical protein
MNDIVGVALKWPSRSRVVALACIAAVCPALSVKRDPLFSRRPAAGHLCERAQRRCWTRLQSRAAQAGAWSGTRGSVSPVPQAIAEAVEEIAARFDMIE